MEESGLCPNLRNAKTKLPILLSQHDLMTKPNMQIQYTKSKIAQPMASCVTFIKQRYPPIIIQKPVGKSMTPHTQHPYTHAHTPTRKAGVVEDDCEVEFLPNADNGKAKFAKATFATTTFAKATFSKATFAKATFATTTFAKATFSKAKFANAKFATTTFAKATFLKLHLQTLNLQQLHLQKLHVLKLNVLKLNLQQLHL